MESLFNEYHNMKTTPEESKDTSTEYSAANKAAGVENTAAVAPAVTKKSIA